MCQERRKESSSESKGGEYCRDSMGPSISFFVCIALTYFSLCVSGNGFLGFSCILGVRTVSVRLHKSGQWDWVLLYALLLDRLHKPWQIQPTAVMQMVLGSLVFSLFLSLQHLVLSESKAILHLQSREIPGLAEILSWTLIICAGLYGYREYIAQPESRWFPSTVDDCVSCRRKCQLHMDVSSWSMEIANSEILPSDWLGLTKTSKWYF